MDLQDLLTRYFGQADIGSIPASTLEAGMERMQVDFGLEQHPGRRFGLWALMYMLGNAPELDIAFEDETERNAARNFMDMVDQADNQPIENP